MAECVDRDELLHAIGELPLAWEYGQAVSEIYEIVKNAPTINPDDLRPRGRWDYYSPTMQECSACKRHTPRHRYAYCPHCGARMEGKDEQKE